MQLETFGFLEKGYPYVLGFLGVGCAAYLLGMPASKIAVSSCILFVIWLYYGWLGHSGS